MHDDVLALSVDLWVGHAVSYLKLLTVASVVLIKACFFYTNPPSLMLHWQSLSDIFPLDLFSLKVAVYTHCCSHALFLTMILGQFKNKNCKALNGCFNWNTRVHQSPYSLNV